MKRSEWIEVVQRIRVNWPHSPVTDAAIAKWYADLADQEAEKVAVAVEAIYREGSQYAPNGAQILAKVGELDRDDPEPGAAWNLAMRCIRKFGFYQQVDGLDWLHDQAPAVAKAVQTYGYAELCHADLEKENTVRAQFRDIYKSVVSRRKRDDAYASLPPAGLKALDKGPKHIGDVVKRMAKGAA